MSDNEVICQFRRMEKTRYAVLTLAQLSNRQITDIIHLLNRCGLLKGGWVNNGKKGKAEVIRCKKPQALRTL